MSEDTTISPVRVNHFRRMVRACIMPLLGPAVRPDRFSRPIFIISPPRSGSTFLFECLCAFPELYHARAECAPVWWSVFPFHDGGAPSDVVGADDITGRKGQVLARHLYREAAVRRLARAPRSMGARQWLGLDPFLYIEKTITNCFHIDALLRVFPDARFVFLVRDPRPTIGSMIDGWRHPLRFANPHASRHMAKRPFAHVSWWCYSAPPGWQQMADRPLPEICAWSWIQHVEQIRALMSRRGQPRAPFVRYEEMTRDPIGTVTGLAESFDLKMTPEVYSVLRQPRLSCSTVTVPDPEKWRVRHGATIDGLLPVLRKTADEIGYSLRE